MNDISVAASAKPPLVISNDRTLPLLEEVCWDDYGYLLMEGDLLTREMEQFYYAALAHKKGVKGGSTRMKEIVAGRTLE